MDTVSSGELSNAQLAILDDLQERLRSFTETVSRRATDAESVLNDLGDLEARNSELRSSRMNRLNTSCLPGLKQDLTEYQTQHTRLLRDCDPWLTYIGDFTNQARVALERLDASFNAIVERRALLVTVLKDSPVR